jgi:hypothetical protein
MNSGGATLGPSTGAVYVNNSLAGFGVITVNATALIINYVDQNGLVRVFKFAFRRSFAWLFRDQQR